MSQADRDYRRDFYRALNQFQGGLFSEEEEFERYYVPIYDRPEGPAGPDVVKEMATEIDFATGGSVQLWSGYRGAGKTTELMRLNRELDHETYAFIYMDSQDYFNTDLPLDGGSFLVGLAAGFVAGCAGLGIPRESLAEKTRRFLERIEVWGDGRLSGSLGPLGIDLRASLRDDDSFREAVSHALKSNRGTFTREVHEFFNSMVDAMPGGKTPVFVVDSIEHFRGRDETFDRVRQSVESVFTEYSAVLRLPRIHVIYTVPTYVKLGWGTRRSVLNVKVLERDGSDCREGIDLLRDVLIKRAPGGDLERLLGNQVDRVIRSSGGLFRDLFRLVSGLLLKNSLPVTETEINEVERQLRSQALEGLSKEQWDFLSEVRRTQKLVVPREQGAEAWRLVGLGYVLCYRNGMDNWYRVHPLLEPQVDDYDDGR